ncbi:hypothetical protein ACKLNO_03650 [Neisseriaceae bacterium B1]
MSTYLNQTVGKLDETKQTQLYQDYLATTLLAQCLALHIAEKSPKGAAIHVRELINQMAVQQRDNPDFAAAEKLALDFLNRCPFE